jgi:hypothetical protein
MMPRGNPSKLIPNSQRTPEELREQTRKGGIASGEARRKKKLMASIYAEVLADKYEVTLNGNKEKIDGVKLVKIITRDVLLRRDAASVAMLREMREGNDKLEDSNQDNEINIIVTDRREKNGN